MRIISLTFLMNVCIQKLCKPEVIRKPIGNPRSQSRIKSGLMSQEIMTLDILNYSYPTPISESVPRGFPQWKSMSSDPAPRETGSMDPVKPVPQRRSGTWMISPAQFKFDKQHDYTIVKGVHYRIICNFEIIWWVSISTLIIIPK